MTKEMKQCKCSSVCRSQTRSNFAPGHDARMVTAKVHQVKYAMITVDEAVQEIRQAGGSDALVTKFRNAVMRQIKVMWECWDDTAYADISQQLTIRWYPTTREEVQNGQWSEVLTDKGEWRVVWFNQGSHTEQGYQFIGESLKDAMDFGTKLLSHKDHYWKYEVAVMQMRDRELRRQEALAADAAMDAAIDANKQEASA